MDFIYRSKVEKEPLQDGILSGFDFAVKDVFAIAGEKNSAGSPDWLATHEAATETALVIQQLLDAGAMMRGLTHSDELMYSLNGENIHYGTPPNRLSVTHIPGGSSNGSAAAAAERTFTIGTDTGGSVRVPASYCGLYGIRPTHDAVSLEGAVPLAKSFDTVGWMSRSSEVMRKVGDVLLKDEVQPFTRIVGLREAWAFLEEENRALLEARLGELVVESVSLEGSLAEWAALFREIQGIEIWQTHGEWVETVEPKFAPAIAERFAWAKSLEADCYEELKKQQRDVVAALDLAEEELLVIPTTASIAPRKQAHLDEVEAVRTRTMQLTCISGLTGFPQVTVPVFREDGMALGLSFIAKRGKDRSLLHFVDAYFGGVV